MAPVDAIAPFHAQALGADDILQSKDGVKLYTRQMFTWNDGPIEDRILRPHRPRLLSPSQLHHLRQSIIPLLP